MIKKSLLCLSLGMASLQAVDVSNTTQLNTALTGNEAAINFTNDITLTSQLFPVNSSSRFIPVMKLITITGNGYTLNGASLWRGFFIRGKTVNISNLTLSNLSHVGGSGGSGSQPGGGGGALGGSLFVSNGTTATLTDVTFTNSSAVGGAGASVSGFGGGGGGGGFLGAGGESDPLSLASGGGGGFFADGGNGGSGGGGGGAGFQFDGGNGPGSSDLNMQGGGAGGGGGTTGSDTGGKGGSGGGGAGDPPGDGGSLGMDGGAGTAGAGGVGSGIASGSGGGGGGENQGVGAPSNGGNGGDGAGGGGIGNGGLAGPTFTGGDGGIFGGGGGGRTGGAGGFAGGGGGGPGFTGGAGGFAAGGGSGATGGGAGGFGGGVGGTTGGGGGAAFGGSIFIERGGDLTLAGTINFSGSSVTGGIGPGSGADGTARGVDIYLMSGGDLTFDLTTDLALQNPIAGNQGVETPGASVPTNVGGLTKKGSALLSLTGDNTFTGTATVQAGEMRINGSVVSNVVIDAGATLTGNFDVNVDTSGANGGDVTNNGTLSPGVAGVGTISLEGQYTQGASGKLLIDITPTGNVNDTILGATQANLAGTMEVVLNQGNYIAGTTYLVIDAPTNGTKFDTIIETGGLGKLIDIQVDYSSVIITIITTSLFKGQTIDPGPASDVVACIRSADIVPDSDFAIMVETLGTLSDSAVNKALVSLSAVRYGALEWINARNNSYAADILSQHLFELCCSPRDCCNGNGWLSFFGNLMDNQKRLDFLRKYDADAFGVLAGVDFCCTDVFICGAALGYTHSHLHWKGHGGTGALNSIYGAFYGSWVSCCYTLDFSLLGGGTDNQIRREIAFASVDRTARGNFWNYFATAHLGLRGDWSCCEIHTLQPFALADYHYYTHGNFTEKGADSLDLKVRSKDQHMMRAEAGLLWLCEYDCTSYCFAPYFGLSWVGEFPLHKSKQPASFIGQSCVINAKSYDSSIQLGSPQVGIKWANCRGVSLLLEYKGQFNARTRINQIEGRIELVF